MNIQELNVVLPILLQNNIVPFLWGQQGIGKTQNVKQIVKKMGDDYQFLSLHLATQADIGDIVGLLIKNDDGTVRHARPEWWPTEGRGVIFLDELNRAHPDIIQAMFSFITEKRIHTHVLPEGWHIVAAGNYATNAFNVTDTSDAAWNSRFCHIDFKPTVHEFTVYADSLGHSDIASFVSEHHDVLEVKHKEGFDFSTVTPDRRSYIDMVARIKDNEELAPYAYEVFQGIIGPSAAAAFLTYRTKETNKIRGKDVLNNYKAVRKRVKEASASKSARFDLLNAALEEILVITQTTKLTDKQLDNFKLYILDVPLEMGLKIGKTLQDSTWSQRNSIINNKEFVSEWSKKGK